MFRIAHFSDPHLGPLPRGATFGDFRLKRLIGSLSWNLKRRKYHLVRVAEAIAADIRASAVDHIACTGDITNIAAPAEFPPAAHWLATLGSPRDVSFVPGNHDSYVTCSWERGLAPLQPFMGGDMRVKDAVTSPQIATPFPFVRLRKNVALIGLSTSVPQPLHKAGGTLGNGQLASLASLLKELRERGFARVILIHHPPFPGLAADRKALTDAEALRAVIVSEGAELLLHGHNHMAMVTPLETRYGLAHAIGVPSASFTSGPHDPAAWNLYAITRAESRWRIQVTVRTLNESTGTIAATSEFALST